MSASHFTPQLYTFLAELKANNTREWFAANKKRYESVVKEPMLGFIAEFAPHLRQISSCFVADPRPSGGSLFRIYRDTRFSRDKSPYKTHAAAQFRHKKAADVHAPGFYLHLEPGNTMVGAGIWRPDTATLGAIREAIVDDARGWQRILASPAFAAVHRLGGESLKRAPKGYDPEHPLITDLKRKSFASLVSVPDEQALGEDFLQRFTSLCRAAAGFMQFLTEAVGLDW